jgi:hypothetical protein
MRNGETEIEMVRRHVREGIEILARQRALIDRLRDRGLPIEAATQMLAEFEDTQRQHQAHLVRLEGA